MLDYTFLKFLHLVVFAYWIGCDFAVYYTSYYVTDDQQPTAVRTAAAKIVFALDQVSRVSMTLMLPLGLHLAWRLKLLSFGSPAMAAIWAVAIAWMIMVIALHRWHSTGPGKQALARVDIVLRIVLATTLVASGLLGLVGKFQLPYWISWKLLIFGAVICIGLLVRMTLKPFGPAFARLAAGKEDAADNAAIHQSLGATRPLVVLIWLSLLTAAALGIHLL